MSKPTTPEPLASIDPTMLATVTGGTSGAGETQALLTQLTGLLDSIKQVSTAGAAQGINPQEMMMMMIMLHERNQQSQPQVVSPWGHNGQTYWYY